MFTLTRFQIREKPMCFGFLTMPYDREVLTYPDVVVYPPGVQKSEPVTSCKLSIGHKMGDAVITSKSNEPGNKFHSLLSVGITPLVHHLKDNWKGHSFVNDTEGEDVDVRVTELPIGPVHRQGIRSLYRNEL